MTSPNKPENRFRLPPTGGVGLSGRPGWVGPATWVGGYPPSSRLPCPDRCIYWVTVTKISVCEGCEGCTAGKSGPDWRLVCERPVCPCVYRSRQIGLRATQTFLSLTSAPNRQNFRGASRRTLQKRIKIAKFSRRFAPKCLYEAHLWVSRPN